MSILHPARTLHPLRLRTLRRHPGEGALVGGGAPPIQQAGARKQCGASTDAGHMRGRVRQARNASNQRGVVHLAARAHAARHHQDVDWRRRIQRAFHRNRWAGATGDCADTFAEHHDPHLAFQIAEHIQRPEHIQQLEALEHQHA